MVDFENEVFSTVATALRAAYSDIYVTGEDNAFSATFPAAKGWEADNSTYERTLDSSGAENYSTVMWQWEVYSNLQSGRKAQCKSIISTIDEQMSNMGFVRVGRNPLDIPNADPYQYRMVARYRAVISKDKTTYRR